MILMRTTTKEEILEICLKKLEDLNFNLLIYNQELFSNPYCLIHPAYLYYLWGKLIGSKDKFKRASKLFKSLAKDALDLNSYTDAGEFSILRLKTEGRLDPSSKEFKNSYKRAFKIFDSLIELNNDPFFMDALIEVEELHEKFSKNKIITEKIEMYYRKASSRYVTEAGSIKINELINTKIMCYFQAASYLDKIKKSHTELDEIEKESILNKVIFEISNQLDKLKQEKQDVEEYSINVLKVNLLYGLGRAHYLLKNNKEGELFYIKCLRKIDDILLDSTLTKSLLKSKEKLYKNEDIYKIHSIEIFSRDLFEKVVILNERIDLLELKIRIYTDLDRFNDKTEGHELNIEEVISYFVGSCLNLKELHESAISPENRNEDLIESITEKYKAFSVFCCYQIIKKLSFLEENLKLHS